MPRGQYERKPRNVISEDNGFSQSAAANSLEALAESAEGSGIVVHPHVAKETVDAAAPPPVKKGRRSWGQNDVLAVAGKDPRFAYKWVRKDPMNLARHLENGYEYDSEVTNSKAVHTPTERMYDGSDLTSTKETRDSILMRLPNELKAERDEWLNERTQARSAGLMADAKKQVGITGSIDIQGGGYKNIIE